MVARKLLVSLGAAGVVAGGVAAVGLGATAHSSAPCAGTPRLRLVASDPVTFKGTGFCAGERLRVRARAGGSKRSHRFRAGDRGRFRVGFDGIAYDPCTSSLDASAWSSDDLRASFKRPQKQCPVPLSPQGGTSPGTPDPGGSAPSGSDPAPDRCSGTDAADPQRAGGKPGPQPQCPPP